MELWADTLLIVSGLSFTLIFTMAAWRGYILWEHRPLAVVEAGFALFITLLGAERFMRDWRGK